MSLSHSPSIVTTGLIMCYDAANPRSYAGSGTTIYDISGNGNTGALTNGPSYNAANLGSIVYDGVNDFIVSPTSTLFDTQTLTMETWVKPTSVLQSGFLFEKGTVNTQYSCFLNGDGTFYFRTMGLSVGDLTFYSPSYITPNAWNHIVCTYGSGTKTNYVNGNQVNQATGVTGTIPTGNANQYVGAYGPGVAYFLNGAISISRVYNISLSAAQVLQNFNAIRGRYGL